MSSSSKAWFFLLTLSIGLIGLGNYFWGRQGLLWALVLSLGFNAIVYFLGDSRLYVQFLGKSLQGRDPWKVQGVCKELVRKARLPMPAIKILPTDAPQALAIGRSWHRGTLVLTQGLLDRLSQDELQAVLAYLLASIKRQDTFVFSIGSFLAWMALAITSFFDTLFRWILGARRQSHSLQSQLFTTLFSPIISHILKITAAHSNYYLIDSLAASWIDSPKSLAMAIWKLDSYSRTIPMETSPSTSHLFIVSPLNNDDWTKHFRSHPKVESRIQRLIGYYPI